MTIDHRLILKEVWDYVGITLGLLLYTIGFTTFLMPYEIVTGGVAGIGAIIYYTTHFPISYTYFLINGILLVIGMRILGWKFLTKTIFAIIMLTFLLGLAQEIIPKDDSGNFVKILGEGQDFMSLVIGCIMTGTALAIVFLNNGSTGGTDIIAASVNKFRNISLGTVLMFVDLIVIGSCLFIPQFGETLDRIHKIVFGFCTMLIENFMLDYVMNRRRQSVQFFIFSKKWQEIANALGTKTDHGVTILDGHGWYTGQERKIICLLARKSESTYIFRLIKMIDPNAFVSQSAVIGVYGEGFDEMKVKIKEREIREIRGSKKEIEEG